jgi:hypothetical protein
MTREIRNYVEFSLSICSFIYGINTLESNQSLHHLRMKIAILKGGEKKILLRNKAAEVGSECLNSITSESSSQDTRKKAEARQFLIGLENVCSSNRIDKANLIRRLILKAKTFHATADLLILENDALAGDYQNRTNAVSLNYFNFILP